jgi:hypothetical protein
MLERLEIRGFQAHGHTRLVFGPRVTTIIGPTDAGKSAALRALLWVATNRPDGLDHINWDAEECRVTLWVDGRVVRRIRGKSVNLYTLEDKPFKAFGQDVPPEIAAIINIDENNYQDQIAPPFWLTEQPLQLSRNLNAIVNLGIIDDTTARLGKGCQRARTAYELGTERFTTARRQRTSLNYVTDLATEYDTLMVAYNRAGAIRQQRAALGAVIATGRKLAQRAAAYTRPIAAGRLMCRAAAAVARLQTRCEGLENLIIDIGLVRAKIQRPPPDIEPLRAARNRFMWARQNHKELGELLGQIASAREYLSTRVGEAARLQTAFEKDFALCPVCKKPRTKS